MNTTNTTSGDGWTLVDGLADAHPGTVKTDYEIPRTDYARATPEVQLLSRRDGVSVVRLAFRAGDVMADHSAASPILLLGQTGEVTVTVSGKDGGNDGGDGDSLPLTPGAALHIDVGRIHSLSAAVPATVTLVILARQ